MSFLGKIKDFSIFGSFVYSCTAIGNEDCEDKKKYIAYQSSIKTVIITMKD